MFVRSKFIRLKRTILTKLGKSTINAAQLDTEILRNYCLVRISE